MECLKTGAHVYFEEYGEFAYGDMFRLKGGAHLMRVNGSDTKPLNGLDIVHFQVLNVGQWWKDKPTGTIICYGANDFGYEGQKIKDVLPHVQVGTKSG